MIRKEHFFIIVTIILGMVLAVALVGCARTTSSKEENKANQSSKNNDSENTSSIEDVINDHSSDESGTEESTIVEIGSEEPSQDEDGTDKPTENSADPSTKEIESQESVDNNSIETTVVPTETTDNSSGDPTIATTESPSSASSSEEPTSASAGSVSSISIQSYPAKSTYCIGETLDTNGLSLNVIYTNGSSKTVASGFACSPTSFNENGMQWITVSYGGKSTSFNVNVAPKTLTSISVAQNPIKTSYTVGESLDTSGLVLTLTYNNGNTETVSSGFTCSPTSFSVAGNQEAQVNYEGKTTSFTVTVSAPQGGGSTLSASVNVGDVVTFGPYQWIVLAKSGNNTMLISKDAVTRMAYNNELASVTWETCTLRSWLNSSFLGNFSAADQAKILTTTVSNPDNLGWGTAGGNTTYDKVFLLSIDEARTYYESDSARVCYYNGSACYWWLRSPGLNSFNAAFVRSGGGVDAGYRVDCDSYAVRPALWVNLGS